MRNIKLFESDEHRFILLNESGPGEEDGIRSNQYLITHHDDGVLLDPGGFGVMPRVLVEMLRYLKPEQIKAIFLAHQDPDIVGGLSTWLALCHSPVYVSSIWIRFLTAKAFIRWRQPERGLLSPLEFMDPTDTEFDIKIGNWLIAALTGNFL